MVRSGRARSKKRSPLRKNSSSNSSPVGNNSSTGNSTINSTATNVTTSAPIDWDHVFYLVRPLIVLVGVGFVTQLTLYVEMKPTRGADDVAALTMRSREASGSDVSKTVLAESSRHVGTDGAWCHDVDGD